MECSCGGETKDNKSVNKKLDLCWEFIECKACHKIGFDVLKNYNEDQILLKGLEARKKYDELTSAIKPQSVKKSKINVIEESVENIEEESSFMA